MQSSAGTWFLLNGSWGTGEIMKVFPAAVLACVAVVSLALQSCANRYNGSATLLQSAQARCAAQGKQFVSDNNAANYVPNAYGVYSVTGYCMPRTQTGPAVMNRSVAPGTETRLDTFFDLNPDCSVVGIPIVIAKTSPAHGVLRTAKGDGYPAYAANTQRYACNTKKIPGAQLFYTAAKDYTGADQFQITVVLANGGTFVHTYDMTIVAP
jgi:hypothetical protein